MAETTDSLEDVENRSDVLNQTTYSLTDASFSRNDSFQLNLRRNGDCDGFDPSTGESWIYPVDVPVRQYQYMITEAALFKNTMVVLPTGLGKTFIAAVVMYNIYRWYPTGKVIFMAPTRPLVSQQIDACSRIVGIPRSDTAEVTGKQPRHKRVNLWQSKRVFYATPQVVLADLEGSVSGGSPIFPAKQVRLVVIDEAHKAKGRYAYTDVIRQLAEVNTCFRVLALSATPGRTLEDVAEVIKNLLISHIEVRYDRSVDLQPYVFRRDVRTIVIPLGQTISRIRKELLRHVNPYLQRLLEANVFARYPDRLTHGMLVMELKRFRNNALHQRHPNHSAIVSDFYACISMYHAMELLVKHGLRAFLNYLLSGSGTNAQEKYFIAKDRQIKLFLDRLKEQFPQHLQQKEQEHGLNDSGVMTGNDDVDFGHPKYRILEKQLQGFFKEHPDSRAIVFCEFRDSVSMIKRLLSDNQPAIRANCIVGQGSSNGVRVPQQEQIDVIRHFRSGTINTLIATCVAEEGIDVGEVDLIVCFDIAKNPTRFVQRVGRTGRQRVGRVLMLVTEGEEHETLKQVLASKDKTNQQLARSKDILRVLYRSSPRLVPPGVEPKCMKVNMAVQSEQAKPDGSDSSDGEGITNRNRRRSKRLNDTTETPEQPFSKRNKMSPSAHYSVRHYFQRRDASGELDASERDIFSLASPNQESRKEGTNDRSHGESNISLSHNRKQSQQTIPALLHRLMQHYKQLNRQKFLYCQELLSLPVMEPKRREQLSNNVPLRMDDPLELPELIPHERCRPDTENLTADEGLDKSISNLFETTASELACLEHDAHFKRKAPPAPGVKKSLNPTAVKKGKKLGVAPLDPSNSPLLLAFNRSVQKKKNSDTLETPVKIATTSAVKSVAAEEERMSMERKMVLEYFKLNDMLDIFDDSSDAMETDIFRITEVQRQEAERAVSKATSINRRLFGELATNGSSNVSEHMMTNGEDFTTASMDRGEHELNLTDKTLRPLEPKTPEPQGLTSKCFDLGSADLVFQDESDTEITFNSPAPSNPPRRGLIHSALSNLRMGVTSTDMLSSSNLEHRLPAPSVRKQLEPSETMKPASNEHRCGLPDLNESIIGRKVRRSNQNRINSSTEDDETIVEQRTKQTDTSLEDTPVRLGLLNRLNKQTKQRKPNRAARAFFESQAVVSDEDNGDDDDDDGHEDEGSLASFLISTDDEQASTVDMRAVYLQSVRSPMAHRGAFKMPSNGYHRAKRGQLPVAQDSYLDVTDAHSDYEEDFYEEMDDGSQLLCSFIDNNVIQSQTMELCELERAEKLIKERRRKSRRDRQQALLSAAGEQKKRQRVILMESSDSD
uniref:Fanconi anemia group M protein n=1 Tax=Anopheles christyi TaxID=43041 RepID=A0A182JY30_9DIPT